jgi:alkylhydroperoxidase family enzyme
VLDQGVQPGDAQVGAAVLHIGRNVACAHEHDTHLRVARLQDQLARLLGVVQHLDPGGLEQRQGLLEDAALGQRERDHAAAFIP